MTGIERPPGHVLFDVHVHIYHCFDLRMFLDSAAENFRSARESNRIDGVCRNVIVLADWLKTDWFGYFMDSARGSGTASPGNTGDWMFHPTKEDTSVAARRPDGESILIIAGRKIITSENLELLALGTRGTFEMGRPLEEMVDRIKRQNALPAIPWAVGKWIGKRGKVVRKILDNASRPDFILCDNGNRPVFWPRPALFHSAERKGIRVLAGSDALHFASESHRVGIFANIARATIDPDRPAEGLMNMLLDPDIRISTYGKLETPIRFFRNQFAMQVLKRKNRKELLGQ